MCYINSSKLAWNWLESWYRSKIRKKLRICYFLTYILSVLSARFQLDNWSVPAQLSSELSQLGLAQAGKFQLELISSTHPIWLFWIILENICKMETDLKNSFTRESKCLVFIFFYYDILKYSNWTISPFSVYQFITDNK